MLFPNPQLRLQTPLPKCLYLADISPPSHMGQCSMEAIKYSSSDMRKARRLMVQSSWKAWDGV